MKTDSPALASRSIPALAESGPSFVVQCAVINTKFLCTVLKEGARRIPHRLADTRQT